MSVPRRSFLARVAAASAALGAMSSTAYAAEPGIGTRDGRTPPKHPQDAWMDAIPGSHRLVIDGPTAMGGAEAAMFAWNYLRTSGAPYDLKDADHAIIIVLRHGGTSFAFPQTLWDKYPKLADEMEVKNPMTDKKVTKSILRPGVTGGEGVPDGFTLDGLAKRGVHIAVCGAATTFMSREIAGKEGEARQKAVYDELVASIPANGHVTTSGMVAVQRAQEYGYSYVRAG